MTRFTIQLNRPETFTLNLVQRQGLPGLSVISEQTDTTISGVLVGDSGTIRAATNAEIITENELNSALSPYLTAAIAADTYVPRAGGTMTGNLVVPSVTLGGVDGPRLDRLGSTIRARSNDGLSDTSFSAGNISSSGNISARTGVNGTISSISAGDNQTRLVLGPTPIDGTAAGQVGGASNLIYMPRTDFAGNSHIFRVRHSGGYADALTVGSSGSNPLVTINGSLSAGAITASGITATTNDFVISRLDGTSQVRLLGGTSSSLALTGAGLLNIVASSAVVNAGSNVAGEFISSSPSDTQFVVRNTSTGGRTWSLVTGGQNGGSGTPTGHFAIRDATAGVNRLSIDATGLVTAAAATIGTGASAANTDLTINQSSAAVQANGLRVVGTGSSVARWRGRIVAGGDNVVFLMGEFDSQAWLGGHNAALTAWVPLRINPDGLQDLYLGNTGTRGTNPILTIRNSDGMSTFSGNVVVPDIRFNNVVNDVGIQAITLRNNFVSQPVIVNGLDAQSRGTNQTAFRSFAAAGTNAILVSTSTVDAANLLINGNGSVSIINPAHQNTFDCSQAGSGIISNIYRRYGNAHGNTGSILMMEYMGGTVASPSVPITGTIINSLSFRTGGSNGLSSTPSFQLRHVIGSTIGSAMSEVNTQFLTTSTVSGVPAASLELLGQTAGVRIPFFLQLGSALGPLLQSEASGTRVGLRNAANTAYAILGADQIWLGGNSFSRIQQDASGRVGIGYNFNLNSNTANRDVTGSVNSIRFALDSIELFSEPSGAAGAISPRAILSPLGLRVNNTNSTTATSGLTLFNPGGTNGRVAQFLMGFPGNFDDQLIGMHNGSAFVNVSDSQIEFRRDIALVGALREIRHSDNGNNSIRFSSGGTPGLRLSGLTQIRIGINFADQITLTSTNMTVAPNAVFTGHITSSFQTLSTDPSTIDIPGGSHRIVKNTTSGEVRDWVNDGGVMKKSPIYT